MSDPIYSLFRRLLEEKSGLLLPDYRMGELVHTVDEIAQATGIGDLTALHARLAAGHHPEQMQRLIQALTIGETYFFRNEPQFRLLEQVILPDIVHRRRRSRTVRIWSAACASGEEPYSVAILLHRLLPDIAHWKIQILATDIDQEALAKAQTGLYRPWSMRQTSQEMRNTYFQREGDVHRVRPHIQQMVTFRHYNLLDQSMPLPGGAAQPFDLILCRNVLIYFSKEAGRRVIRLLQSKIDREGWLLVGHAEPQDLLTDSFRPYPMDGATAYRPRAYASQELPPTPSALTQSAWPSALAQGARPAENTTQADAVAKTDTGEIEQEVLQLWQAGRVEQALRLLQRLNPHRLTRAETGYRIAHLYASRALWDDALAWLEPVLARNPLLAQAHYLQGVVYHERGQYDKALASFRKTLYADPQYVLAYISQATVLEKMGERERAAKALDNVARWLENRDDDEPVVADEDLTVGGLRNLLMARQHAANRDN